jgi:hypothetical protein
LLPELDGQIEKELEGRVFYKGSFSLDEPLHVFFKRYLHYARSLCEKLEKVEDLETFFCDSDSYIDNDSFQRLLKEA